MSLVHFVLGFSAGAVFTAVAGLLYIRHKMRAQLGAMEQQMQGLMEATEGLNEELDMEDMDHEEN